MRVAVVSSVYGGYDRPAAPAPQTVAAEWVLVSDRLYEVPPWRCVVEPSSMDPRMAAKIAKARPDLYVQADVYIWVDASIQVANGEFVSWCLEHLERGDVAQVPHPQRRCIRDEAHVVAPRWPMAVAQAAHYMEQGHPPGWGLWATGVIASRGPLPFGGAWLREMTRWTPRDQVSQPPLLRSAGIRPVDMHVGKLHHNTYFTVRSHGGG